MNCSSHSKWKKKHNKNVFNLSWSSLQNWHNSTTWIDGGLVQNLGCGRKLILKLRIFYFQDILSIWRRHTFKNPPSFMGSTLLDYISNSLRFAPTTLNIYSGYLCLYDISKMSFQSNAKVKLKNNRTETCAIIN